MAGAAEGNAAVRADLGPRGVHLVAQLAAGKDEVEVDENVIVPQDRLGKARSLGGEGALWVSERGTMVAPAIPVRVQSTVGAGDAMVGGVMAGLEKTGDVRRALAYGAAAGCASVMTEGTQLIRPDDFAALLPQVQIQDV